MRRVRGLSLTPGVPQLNLSANPWARPGLCCFQGKTFLLSMSFAATSNFHHPILQVCSTLLIHDSLYLLWMCCLLNAGVPFSLFAGTGGTGVSDLLRCWSPVLMEMWEELGPSCRFDCLLQKPKLSFKKLMKCLALLVAKITMLQFALCGGYLVALKPERLQQNHRVMSFPCSS